MLPSDILSVQNNLLTFCFFLLLYFDSVNCKRVLIKKMYTPSSEAHWFTRRSHFSSSQGDRLNEDDLIDCCILKYYYNYYAGSWWH